MSTSPLADVVSSQYAKWMYPAPILDLPDWLLNNWQWFDPSHAHRLFWPDRDDCPALDILIAGCGTNQAAVIAYTNPQSRVLAVDVSQPSLNHHQWLKSQYGLANLELRQLPIEELPSLNQDFDLIISTGVLHHLASPEVGIRALSQCLRRDGAMALMLYAKYGRLGVDMLQALFRDWGLDQSEASVRAVRELLKTLPSDHPVQSYINLAPDLNYDAGLVDTFLHGRERNYTVRECIELVASANLVFQDFFLKSPYYPPPFSSMPVQGFSANLSREQVWSAMELINFRNGCHFFTACRADRAVESYRIDFSAHDALSYVPQLRYRCQLSGSQISRSDWSMNLEWLQSALLRHMDGRRTIQEIAANALNSGEIPPQSPAAIELLTKRLFQTLWQLDFVSMGLRKTS